MKDPLAVVASVTTVVVPQTTVRPRNIAAARSSKPTATGPSPAFPFRLRISSASASYVDKVPAYKGAVGQLIIADVGPPLSRVTELRTA